MSWWGSCPTMTKAEARKLLPPSACRICVYYVSVYGHMKDHYCGRGCTNDPRARLHPLKRKGKR
jgi:hypothetical protein